MCKNAGVVILSVHAYRNSAMMSNVGGSIFCEDRICDDSEKDNSSSTWLAQINNHFTKMPWTSVCVLQLCLFGCRPMAKVLGQKHQFDFMIRTQELFFPKSPWLKICRFLKIYSSRNAAAIAASAEHTGDGRTCWHDRENIKRWNSIISPSSTRLFCWACLCGSV